MLRQNTKSPFSVASTRHHNFYTESPRHSITKISFSQLFYSCIEGKRRHGHAYSFKVMWMLCWACLFKRWIRLVALQHSQQGRGRGFCLSLQLQQPLMPFGRLAPVIELAALAILGFPFLIGVLVPKGRFYTLSS